MFPINVKRLASALLLLLPASSFVFAQNSFKLKYENSAVYAGIEVGAKGVKMSILEIGKNAQKTGAFNVLKDTSINSDFITFSPSTFQATLNAFAGLYAQAKKDYNISTESIFTVVSSGVKSQAEKDNKNVWIKNLIDSFKIKGN